MWATQEQRFAMPKAGGHGSIRMYSPKIFAAHFSSAALPTCDSILLPPTQEIWLPSPTCAMLRRTCEHFPWSRRAIGSFPDIKANGGAPPTRTSTLPLPEADSDTAYGATSYAVFFLHPHSKKPREQIACGALRALVATGYMSLVSSSFSITQLLALITGVRNTKPKASEGIR